MGSQIFEKLESIERMLTEKNLFKKEVLNFNEAALYLEVSHSHLYKLTSSHPLLKQANPMAGNEDLFVNYQLSIANLKIVLSVKTSRTCTLPYIHQQAGFVLQHL